MITAVLLGSLFLALEFSEELESSTRPALGFIQVRPCWVQPFVKLTTVFRSVPAASLVPRDLQRLLRPFESSAEQDL